MAGRILGGSCGNVRLFSVPPLFPSSSLLSLFLSLLFLRCSLRVFSFLLFGEPESFFLFEPAGRFVPPSHRSPRVPPSLRSPSRSSFRALVLFIEAWLPSGTTWVIGVTPSRYTRYVVCPIFTHGKSTLKKRWAPARSSFLSSPSMSASFLFYPLYHGCFSISTAVALRSSHNDQRVYDGNN